MHLCTGVAGTRSHPSCAVHQDRIAMPTRRVSDETFQTTTTGTRLILWGSWRGRPWSPVGAWYLCRPHMQVYNFAHKKYFVKMLPTAVRSL